MEISNYYIFLLIFIVFIIIIHYKKNKEKNKENYIDYTAQYKEILAKRKEKQKEYDEILKKQREEAIKRKVKAELEREKIKQEELDKMKKDLIKVKNVYDEKMKIKQLEDRLMQQKEILSGIEGEKKMEKENKEVKALSPDESNDLLVSQSSTSFSLYPNGMYRSLEPSKSKTFSDDYHIEDDQLVFEQEDTKQTDIQGVLNNLCTKYYIL